MASWASWVEPPMCGVRTTLGSPRSARLESRRCWPRAPPGRRPPPRRRDASPGAPAASASMSTTVPRLALIRHAPFFIRASCGGADHPVRLRRLRHVEGDEVALLQERIERLHRLRVAQGQLRRDVVEDDAHPQVLGEDADLRADVPVADDARGSCRGPRGDPVATFLQTPWCISRERSPSWRESMTISAITISATLRVLENGALKTGDAARHGVRRARSGWCRCRRRRGRRASPPRPAPAS